MSVKKKALCLLLYIARVQCMCISFKVLTIQMFSIKQVHGVWRITGIRVKKTNTLYADVFIAIYVNASIKYVPLKLEMYIQIY